MKCSFCGNAIPPGTGKIHVRKDGTVLYFCKSKCERNFFMREPKHVKWTQASRKLRSKQ